MAVIRSKDCPECGEHKNFTVTEEQYKQWNDPNGPHIQNIFPNMHVDDRERLLSGLCAPCWDKVLGPEE